MLRSMGHWIVCGLALCAGTWYYGEGSDCQTALPAERAARVRTWGGRHVHASHRIMERLKAENPEAYAQLEELKCNDRHAYYDELKKTVSQREFTQCRLADMERSCLQLSKNYGEARTEEERAVLKKELTKCVEESTDLTIEDFRDRLVRMEKQLKGMEARRQQLIDRRVNNLLKIGCRNGRRGGCSGRSHRGNGHR